MASSFDDVGGNKRCMVVQHLAYFHHQDGDLTDDVIDQCVLDSQTSQVSNVLVFFDTHETELGMSPEDSHPEPASSGRKVISKCDPHYYQLRPLFGWSARDLAKKTFEHTTQFASLPAATLLKNNAYKSPNPALNVYHWQEDVACDIVYSDVPAIHDGSTAVVIFGITDKKFVNTSEDSIIQCGAPLKLVSYCGQAIVSHKVANILCTFCINNWQSEPHKQHQNPTEQRYQTIKNWTGAPAHTWLFTLQYVCFLLNHMYNTTLDLVPLTCLQGSIVDVSALLRFHFWQPVYLICLNTLSHLNLWEI
jgi:hypothetical protein